MLKESIENNENQELIAWCNLSCKHAIDILDDLLYVEMDENKPLKKEPTDILNFYKECIVEQFELSHAKNIHIDVALDDIKIIKNIDQNQFRRALQNVIVNAIKFSYPSSAIKISTKVEDERITLKILDAGIGIPERFHADIFKRFTPAGRLGTNGEPSTGLGLCFTKDCIEQHGGSIYFKSVEGKGTKFYIVL